MSAVAVLENIDIDQMDKEIEEELKTTVTLAIQTELLKKMVSKVERSVAKKSVQDIFKFIYMDIQPDRLVFRAINNDYLTEAVALQNEEATNFKITAGKPGSICFPGDKFVQIVKKLNHKNTEIRIQANNAVIKSGRPTFDLNGVDGSQFPQTPDLGESKISVSIHPNVLSMIYDRTIYAASTKETRPILTGVYHKLSGNILKCVSTDAHRLAQFVYELDEEYPDISTTVPTSVLSEVKKHLDAAEKEVIVHFYPNRVVYELDDVTLYARVLDGSYPVTDRLIFASEQAGSSIVVHAGAFKELLSNSTVYNPDQPIIIRIKPELNQLRVNTYEAGVGAFQQDIATAEGKGADVVVGVNVRYLQEALARYNNDDYIRFEFLPSAPNKPAGIQPFKGMLNNGNADCLELFVPVRSSNIDYNAPVVIDNFQGIPEFEFNPFELEFEEMNNE
jgi:DNA polymerase III subunit beta